MSTVSISTNTSNYVSYCAFTLLYAGCFTAIVYFSSSRGENAYYSQVAANSIIFFGMVVLLVNLFILALQSPQKWMAMIGISLFMFMFFSTTGKEIYLLLKNKDIITKEEMSDTFWKCSSFSLFLNIIIIGILSYIFSAAAASLSMLAVVSLCLFAFFKLINIGYMNNLLTYFLTDGFV